MTLYPELKCIESKLSFPRVLNSKCLVNYWLFMCVIRVHGFSNKRFHGVFKVSKNELRLRLWSFWRDQLSYLSIEDLSQSGELHAKSTCMCKIIMLGKLQWLKILVFFCHHHCLQFTLWFGCSDFGKKSLHRMGMGCCSTGSGKRCWF